MHHVCCVITAQQSEVLTIFRLTSPQLMVTYCIPISVLFWAPKNQFFHEKIEKPMGKNGGVKLSKIWVFYNKLLGLPIW